MKKYVRQYKGSRMFEDFAEYVNIPVEDIIDDFCDAEYREYIVIPESMQLDSEYRNDDIYSTSRIPRSVDGSASIDDTNNNASKQPNSKLNQIRDKITKGVKKVRRLEAGFPEDEVEEYSVVEVDPSGKVEVRAEVDYDGLMSLCDALNPIVQRYDKDSYFEPVQPGIIQAWVNTQNDVIESSTTLSDRYWYFTRHGVQPGSVPKYVNILDIIDTPEGSYFLADGVILTNDLRDYDIKERKPEDSVTSSTRIKSKVNNQYTDADLQDIAEKIEAVVVAVIMQDEGFDESEAKMYSRVTISDIDDNGLYIEVGAEVGYESLERICSECDKVIQALPGVDENSYFEPIEPGLAGCYVYSK